MRRIFVTFSICVLLIQQVEAGNILDNLGFMNNVNKPEVWKDQLGNYASAGSIHARTPTHELQLMNVDMPSISMGCGGIDLHLGGAGFISGKQFMSTIKAIPTHAVTYMGMIAIKTLSQMIGDELQNLERLIGYATNQSLNSCQLGQALAGGILSSTQEGRKMACQARQNGGNGVGEAVSDFFTSRANCRTENDISSTNKEEAAGLLPDEYNLVWYALNKLKGDISQSDKEFLMSVSGTIISTKDADNKRKMQHKTSLLLGEKLLETVVYGGNSSKYKIYKCNEDKECLNPTQGNETLHNDKSLLNKVTNIIESISQKVANEGNGSSEQLSNEEKDMVSGSSVPILLLIKLYTSLKGHEVTASVSEYAEAIAFEYAIEYIDSLTFEVLKAINNIEVSQMETNVIKDFKKELRDVRKELTREREKVMANVQTLIAVKQQTAQLLNQAQLIFSDFRSAHE